MVAGSLMLAGCTDSTAAPDGPTYASRSSSADGSRIPVPTRPVESTSTTDPAPETRSPQAEKKASELRIMVEGSGGDSSSGVGLLSGVLTKDAPPTSMESADSTLGRYRAWVACDSGRLLVELGDLRRNVVCSGALTELSACVRSKPVMFTVERADRGRQQIPFAVTAERVGGC